MTPSIEERLDRIETRNARLEAENRWWKRASLAATAAASAALLVGQAGARDKDGDALKAKTIEAQEITLVDATGKPRVEIGVDKDGAGIDVRDVKGKVRLALGEGGGDKAGGGAGLWVFDEKERPRVGMGLGKEGTGLVVLDENGKPVAGEGKGR